MQATLVLMLGVAALGAGPYHVAGEPAPLPASIAPAMHPDPMMMAHGVGIGAKVPPPYVYHHPKTNLFRNPVFHHPLYHHPAYHAAYYPPSIHHPQGEPNWGFWNHCRLKHGTGDLFPHVEYYPENHGHYYFRPHNFEGLMLQSRVVSLIGGDPQNPYDNRFVDEIFTDLGYGPEAIPLPEEEVEVEETGDEQPAPQPADEAAPDEDAADDQSSLPQPLEGRPSRDVPASPAAAANVGQPAPQDAAPEGSEATRNDQVSAWESNGVRLRLPVSQSEEERAAVETSSLSSRLQVAPPEQRRGVVAAAEASLTTATESPQGTAAAEGAAVRQAESPQSPGSRQPTANSSPTRPIPVQAEPGPEAVPLSFAPSGPAAAPRAEPTLRQRSLLERLLGEK